MEEAVLFRQFVIVPEKRNFLRSPIVIEEAILKRTWRFLSRYIRVGDDTRGHLLLQIWALMLAKLLSCKVLWLVWTLPALDRHVFWATSKCVCGSCSVCTHNGIRVGIAFHNRSYYCRENKLGARLNWSVLIKRVGSGSDTIIQIRICRTNC